MHGRLESCSHEEKANVEMLVMGIAFEAIPSPIKRSLSLSINRVLKPFPQNQTAPSLLVSSLSFTHS